METGSHRVNGRVSVNHILTNEGEDCLGSLQRFPCLSLFPIQNWSVCPLKQLSCLCFFWCCEVHQYSSGLERERLIFSRGSWVTHCQHQHQQQGQILCLLASPTVLQQEIYPATAVLLAGEVQTDIQSDIQSGQDRILSGKDSDVTPTLILATPNESTGKSKQACKVMGSSLKKGVLLCLSHQQGKACTILLRTFQPASWIVFFYYYLVFN